jgi:amino acid transporter
MYSMFQKLRRVLLGRERHPLSPGSRQDVALIALFAWMGLGADGLSSSCYGPQESFLALGPHVHLGLYLAIATALTVFIISFSYNQVIDLFPNGGGGYKVATQLLHPTAGLVSGVALIIDYVLTITISIAGAGDALFSLLPSGFLELKLMFEVSLIILLMVLNLRGMKESIKVLMPIFIGFVVTHFVLIVYGIISHDRQFPVVINDTLVETHRVASKFGWAFSIVMFVRAYAMGGSTYTGLEAVSNNVNTLVEPRVRTGKWTMLYMALSLSITAGGIMLLYLLWNVSPVEGKTLNAVVFGQILSPLPYAHSLLVVVLALEAGLLFVGANTGFLGGPSVLANMALDSWVPNRFRVLSSRLVTQNGIVLFGVAALLILLWSNGSVAYLVVLYSIDVFLTFSLSLLGLCVYWLNNRDKPRWLARLLLSLTAFLICFGILSITLVTKFSSGGWFAIAITLGLISLCWMVKRHYRHTEAILRQADDLFGAVTTKESLPVVPDLQKDESTAVFFIGNSRGAATHTVMWAQRLFPGQFKNFVFVRVGVVDVENFTREFIFKKMQQKVEADLKYMVNFAHQQGVPAKCYRDYGTDPVKKLTRLAEQIAKEFPKSIFFASNLIFPKDNGLKRLLHNETAQTLQRRLHLNGLQMVILPMQVN